MEARTTSVVLDVVLQHARKLDRLHRVSRLHRGIHRLLVQCILGVREGKNTCLSVQTNQQIAARDHALVHTGTRVPDHSLHHF